MKKYKQVLAALLAMNLTVYVTPTGAVTISASVENQSNENTALGEPETYSEENNLEISSDLVTETSEAGADETVEAENVADDGFFGDETDSTPDSEPADSGSGGFFGDEVVDEPTEDANTVISEETEKDASTFDDGQQDTAETSEEEAEVSAQTGEIKIQPSDLTLKRFKHYKDGTMTIEDQVELILLSYCDPNELQDITIHFNKAAESDLTKVITEGDNLTDYLYDAEDASSDVPENEEEDLENDVIQSQTNSEVIDTSIADANVTSSENNEELSELAIQKENVENADAISAQNELINEDSAATADNRMEDTEQSDGTDADNSIQDNTTVQKVIAGQEFTFQGFGSEAVPFRGTISGIKPSVLKIARPFFNGFSSNVTFSLSESKTLDLTWVGNERESMIANVFYFEDGSNYDLPIMVTNDKDNTGTMGCLIGTVKAFEGITAGSLTIGKYVTSDKKQITYGAKVISNPEKGNAGLICNTLENGTICLDGYEFPTTYTVTSADGNAGGVIGVMKKGTKLEIKGTSTITPAITAKINAGGLVGEMESETELIVEGNLTVDNPTITGVDTAGGVAGKAKGTNFSIEGNIEINGPGEDFGKPMVTGKKVGGVIGHYIVNTTAEEQSMPQNIEVTNPHLKIAEGSASSSSDGGNAGGYFGFLELAGTGTYNIENSENKTLNTYYENGAGYAYGGLIGRVTSEDIRATLRIQNLTINSYFDNGIKYHGGVIGELGIKDDELKATYLEISGVTVTAYNPFAANDSDLGFGGLVGRLGKRSILKVNDVTVSTKSKVGKSATNGDTHIWEGGGIVGGASSGSVIELSGTTDLSGVHYIGRFSTGQLVGAQDGALIYARGDGNGKGWTFKRSDLEKEEVQSNCSRWKVNDIGNYGEIIRLKTGEATTGLSSDLITITDEHEVKLKSLVTDWSDDITINSTEEFALLSIAINSRGTFWADTEHVFDYENLFSKNITFKNGITVDLTGTGILGLTRDNSGEKIYSGDLNGNGSTIILDTGTEFGLRGDTSAITYGSGKLYAYQNDGYHNSQGIFAKASGNISNLTVKGKIALTSDRGNSDKNVRIGGIAAQSVAPDGKKKTVDNVTIDELKITAEVSGENSNFISFSVGGIYGDDFGTQELYIQDKSEIKPVIEVIQTEVSLDTKIYAGGILGQVSGTSFKLRCENVTVGGSVTSNVSQYAYIGGLVGVIQNKDGNRWIEIADLTCNGLKIEAPNATEVCGGLFGAIWANVHVYFENKDNPGVTKLTVNSESSVDAQNAASVGGLVYRSSGLWEIQDKGIDMQQLSINAKEDVGLLVCRGENKEKEVIGGSENNIGALYLRTTAYWGTAYKLDENNVTVTGNTGVFDEFLAHTANTASEITDNNKNGVISLATENRVGVNKDSTRCTTYVNRTTYGKNHQTNGCSRYYYDLDKYITDAYDATGTRNNKCIDTEQELLLWSVERYAYSNIKKYFYSVDEDEKKIVPECQECYTIGPASGDKSFDMHGYSYYPINLSTNMVVRNSTFTFYNQDIEEAEKNAVNKKTKGTESSDSDHSQHYTMHCGLFFNDRTTKYTGSITTRVYNVTFKGSIGRLSSVGGSGALFAGMVNGSIDNNEVYTATVKVTGGGITLDGLKVTDYGTEDGYAPLLINRIRDYTTLEVSGGITALLATDQGTETGGYTAGTPVASSLIGNVGTNEENNGSKQMNLSFSNIKVPDMSAKSGKGIFSHATLLESFQYGGSSVATYNFYQEDDYAADGTTYDHHKVTYGREISGSSEYPDMQKWYYNEENYGHDSRLVKVDGDGSKTDFSSYLPYVYTDYNSETLSHEIKVNQRVAEITDGCGTYTHPYVITSDREMNIIAEYLATGNARKDWRIRIVKDQTAVCSKNDLEDVILQYNVDDETNWKQVENKKTEDNKDNWVPVTGGLTIDNSTVHSYLLNAYYDIQGENGKLTLKDFDGFGTSVNPFRGVITSSNNVELTLNGAGTCRGLIPYSYGSVIRNLKITYQGEGITLTKNATANTASDYFPDACFGGVIGCVLGGDNIIEGVTVTVENQWITLNGSKKHLLQVGGYVGSVCGGGVIFREMTDSTGLSDNAFTSGSVSTNENGRLYVNPYVGRVLNGFVFNESPITLNNTERNYQINTLNSGEYITATAGVENSFEVSGSQGLLILAAIVNSGAASGGVSNAYKTSTTEDSTSNYKFGNNSYGKVRNALYNNIGDVTEATKNGDLALANADDSKSASETNLPYLIKKYCDASAFDIANPDKNITINLNSTGNCDMTQYGTAYQGISARYVTNAVLSEKTNTPKGVIPQLTEFNGNGVNVIVDMYVREYEDDDFHAASVGGVFNLLDVVSKGKLQNLTVKGTDASKGVSLTYYGSDGSEKTEASSEWLFKNRYGNTHRDNEGRQYSFKESVGVGGFAGSTTSVSAGDNNGTVDVTFNNLNLESMTVDGPVSSGGLLGNAGRAAIEAIGDGGNNTQLNRYSDTEIPIKDIAILIQPNKGVSTVAVNITNCSYDNLAVKASKAAGGFVGYVDGISDATICSSNISAGRKTIANNISKIGNTDNSTSYAGGVFGYTKTNINVNTGSDTQTATLQNIEVAAKIYAGGVVGFVNGSKQYQIKNVTIAGSGTNRANVSAIYKNDNYISAGGIIGEAIGDANNSIDNCHFKNADINNSTNFALNQEGQRNGGIIGYIRSGSTTISDCTVQAANVYGSRSGGIAGGVAVQTVIKNCKVLGTASDNFGGVKGTKIAGGIIGISSVSGGAVRLEGCKVKYMQMTSNEWGAGGLIGDVDYNAHKELYLFDCAVENSKIEGTVWGATAGGISGTMRDKMAASNILLSSVTVTNKNTSANNKVGILIGVTGDKDRDTISVAGLSLQNIIATNKNGTVGLYGVADEYKEAVKNNSYFAFADYFGVSCTTEEEDTSEEGSSEIQEMSEEEKLSAGKENLLNAEGTWPYVVTSPRSSLAVLETDVDAAKYLYGDGASWTTTNGASTFTVNAQQIFENRNQASGVHYAYSNTGVNEKDIDFSSVISTYKTNQATTAATDFPVLQITAGDTSTITKYLDILTNGGFSQANQLNSSSSVHVTANATVYRCNKNGTFVKQSDQESALKVSKDSSNQINFSTTKDYDNNQDRFTLLTVTFSENDENGKQHKYNIQVPVIVRRMLEMDFTATLSYGTNFKSSAYEKLTHHVLESFGSSITGYLTYTYNSAENEYTDYGWQSYIEAGGDVASAMEKKIDFVMSAELPKGTQLSLVDCSSGKVYYYTATGQEKKSISLNSFKASDGTLYESPSIGEVMGATVSSTGGSFIKVDQNGMPDGGAEDKEYPKPTVRIKNGTGYDYYRLAISGENGTCTITVDESKLHKTEKVKDSGNNEKEVIVSSVSENYYLVITVPEGKTTNILNGSLQTTITNSIPNQLHYRTIGRELDDHNETASTYLISSGYKQKLTEENITDLSKKVNTAGDILKVDVVDEITFPNGQAYADYDALYLRIVGGLQTTVDEKTSSVQFPSGTEGTANFYVYTVDKNTKAKTYYTYNNVWDSSDQENVAVSYTWKSDGGNMELLFSTDGKSTGLLSLAGVRSLVKGRNTTGNSTFYVEVKMDASIKGTGVKVIPESTETGGIPVDYAKLVYSSQISTETESLSYSANRASESNTRTAYYREAPTGATLTYDADQVSQLGINLLDLQALYLDSRKENALIDTTAIYNLAQLKNLDGALSDSYGIRFTLKLLQKNTTGTLEEYDAPLPNADNYLTLELKSNASNGNTDTSNGTETTVKYESGTWSWIIPQETYWENGNVKTSNIFDGSELTQRIQLKVNVDNIEEDTIRHYYSNYKVVLTAEILNSAGEAAIENTTQSDYIIYTLAKINPKFIKPDTTSTNP